jgi:hypothetical protein
MVDLAVTAYSGIVYTCSLYVHSVTFLTTGHGASGLQGEWLFKASLVDLTTKIVIVRLPPYVADDRRPRDPLAT